MGTLFPGATADYSVVDLTHGAVHSSHPSSLRGPGSNDVVLTLGASIPARDFLQVVADGVVNPAPGDYAMTLAGYIGAAVPPTPPAPVTPTVPAPARTTTTVSAAPNPALVGEAVSITATVSPRPAYGAVSFTSGGALLSGCSLRPVVNGQATCSARFSTVGEHNVEASYSGERLRLVRFHARGRAGQRDGVDIAVLVGQRGLDRPAAATAGTHRGPVRRPARSVHQKATGPGRAVAPMWPW